MKIKLWDCLNLLQVEEIIFLLPRQARMPNPSTGSLHRARLTEQGNAAELRRICLASRTPQANIKTSRDANLPNEQHRRKTASLNFSSIAAIFRNLGKNTSRIIDRPFRLDILLLEFEAACEKKADMLAPPRLYPKGHGNSEGVVFCRTSRFNWACALGDHKPCEACRL